MSRVRASARRAEVEMTPDDALYDLARGAEVAICERHSPHERAALLAGWIQSMIDACEPDGETAACLRLIRWALVDDEQGAA